VFDFEPVARKNIPVAHWGYLMTGTDDEGRFVRIATASTATRCACARLVDVSRIDPSIEMLGVHWDTPIVLCPVGSQKAFHREGELAVARAAKAKRHLQVLSTLPPPRSRT
jgi:isopentenyl diphosphate isomerase/L-lactate dehydrogenase-like FMN-dependent dehydrogenase